MGENNILVNDDASIAQEEIKKTLSICNFCSRKLGFSLTDPPPTGLLEKIRDQILFSVSFFALTMLVVGEIAYVVGLIIHPTSVAEFVTSLHIVGYGSMSLGKVTTIWLKRHKFRQLVSELTDLWPVSCENAESEGIKRDSLRALRLGQSCYTFFNGLGVVLYSVTPILLHLYRWNQNQPSDLGYIWHVRYPFDKNKPGRHAIIYVFEVFSGSISVLSMLASDLMFTTMASHISMLLRLLQVRIRNLFVYRTDMTENEVLDGYQDIVELIKIHQRLIKYSNDIEDAFSVANLINVVLSSINICCVLFVIVLLEPWMDLSNKFFLGAALTQVGIICWFADDIYRASIGVGAAVYDSTWYNSIIKCQRALLVLLQRSQKPFYFTAFKFRPITMNTYTSILTTSYSYFALLYTVYRSS